MEESSIVQVTMLTTRFRTVCRCNMEIHARYKDCTEEKGNPSTEEEEGRLSLQAYCKERQVHCEFGFRRWLGVQSGKPGMLHAC